jgi:hypothetical protein
MISAFTTSFNCCCVTPFHASGRAYGHEHGRLDSAMVGSDGSGTRGGLGIGMQQLKV